MMDELNILESGADAPERKLHFHAIAEFFCVLLLLVLLSDPIFTRSADKFFDLLLVPIAETGNANPVYEKNSGNLPDMQITTNHVLKELDLKNPVIPSPAESCLLTEVVTTGQSLMLEDSFNQNNDHTEDVKNFPVLAMADESIVKDTVPENPTDEWIEFNDNTVDFNAPVNSEDSSDLEVQLDSRLPSDIQEVSESIASDVMQDPDSTQTFIDDSTIQESSTIQDSIVQEPLSEEPQTPGETIADSTISKESPDLSTPELPEPDSAISDVADPADMETGAKDDTAVETTSCFLIDEAGMLFGFLPEYAQIQDGYLMLPEECIGIRSGTFSGTGAQIEEIYIPAGITLIEDGAFIGLDSLTYIDVDSSNPVYTNINGVLFDSTATVLLSFPAGRIGTYLLPAQVTQIANGAFTDTSLSHLDFRRCPSLFLGENIFGPSFGDGIVIAVPAESLPVYEDMFSAYAVILML